MQIYISYEQVKHNFNLMQEKNRSNDHSSETTRLPVEPY